jgi:hypothetical protein
MTSATESTSGADSIYDGELSNDADLGPVDNGDADPGSETSDRPDGDGPLPDEKAPESTD